MAECCYVSFDIQAEIMKKLPVKSLIRCRLVSKSWKSLIDSFKFIADHSINHKNWPNRLLVRYKSCDFEHVSIDDDDDDSFPEKKVIHTSIPMSDIFAGKPYNIIGISQGLFCFYNMFESTTTVIWNPSIRTSVAIEMPNMLYCSTDPVIGFGVCPRTSDVKLIRIKSYEIWKVEVFTLSSGTWTSFSTNWPNRIIVLKPEQVDLDRHIYWPAWEIDYLDDDDDDDDDAARKKPPAWETVCGDKMRNTIISFDVSAEKFTQVYLPPKLTNPTNPTEPALCMSISKLADSLVVFLNTLEVEGQVCGVWMMEHDGVSRSFTKLFTIGPPDACIRRVLGFRKNGIPILEVEVEVKSNNGRNLSDIVAYYEPNFHLVMCGGIIRNMSFVSSYVETLLLLDQ
ncbi:F-box/kelch-repeat protein At3g23880-like [Rutidosis leptorrhynchoides]|uniref:F-box/kelch-repeat protein At3g23880-like n=1 Tax=Rutidosis leptorrhynchoides TaxID=125765 RepID=UPI003A99D19F